LREFYDPASRPLPLPRVRLLLVPDNLVPETMEIEYPRADSRALKEDVAIDGHIAASDNGQDIAQNRIPGASARDNLYKGIFSGPVDI
jgi:hypothetical protein